MSIYGQNIYLPSSNTSIEENVIDDVKKKITDIKKLKDQWKGVSETFVKHKWIDRYINDKQKVMLDKYYKMLTDDDTSYGDYKKAFKFICRFMGLTPPDQIIIENLVFQKDNKDKDQLKVSVKYSKGFKQVTIPEDVQLIHVSPVGDIKELIPSFRSKVKGKYMYPEKRCFFTVQSEIKSNKAGLEKQARVKYTPTSSIRTAYIDPTYADFSDGSVYIPTTSPIPVKKVNSTLDDVRNKVLGTKPIMSNSDKEEVKKESYIGIYGRNIYLEASGEDSLEEGALKDFIDSIKEWKTSNEAHGEHTFKSTSLTNEEYEHYTSLIKTMKTAEKYGDYKKAFNEFCKLCHIMPQGVIITKYETKKGSKDDNNEILVKYTENTKKIKLPESFRLFHMSTVANIKKLIPQFRGKSQKGYLYDKPRIYFTVNKNMPKLSADYKPTDKVHKYMAKEDIKDVYVDPLLWSRSQGAVYIETNKEIPVEEVGIKKDIENKVSEIKDKVQGNSEPSEES